jgi:hypothetical protein
MSVFNSFFSQIDPTSNLLSSKTQDSFIFIIYLYSDNKGGLDCFKYQLYIITNVTIVIWCNAPLNENGSKKAY